MGLSDFGVIWEGVKKKVVTKHGVISLGTRKNDQINLLGNMPLHTLLSNYKRIVTSTQLRKIKGYSVKKMFMHEKWYVDTEKKEPNLLIPSWRYQYWRPELKI